MPIGKPPYFLSEAFLPLAARILGVSNQVAPAAAAAVRVVLMKRRREMCCVFIRSKWSMVFVPPKFFVDVILVFVFVVQIDVGDVAASLARFACAIVFSGIVPGIEFVGRIP